MSKQVLIPRLCFLRNQICYKHSVDAGLARHDCEPFLPELQQRIEVAEQNQRYIDVLPNLPRAGERVVHGHAVSQRPFGCALNYFAVRDRIAERHAQLDHVCSRFPQLK